ncbi:bicyclomycin/multidrug efflux system [Pelomyxa schiedti]|nr:bicyclomycin/multidrug efflux system [Pelomyxa schiedti]
MIKLDGVGANAEDVVTTQTQPSTPGSIVYDYGDAHGDGGSDGTLVDGDEANEEGGATMDGVTRRDKVRFVVLLVEMTVLTLSVMFIEVMLVPALNIIGMDYYEQIEWVPWVLSAYLITGGISTPIFGAMTTTKFGIKKTLAICLGCYIAGVIGCGLSFLSSEIVVLILLRGLQGLGMGSFTLCFTLTKASFPKPLVGPTIGIVSSMFAIGAAVGMLGGGGGLEKIEFTYKGENMSWATLFWIAAPVVTVLVVSFMISIKEPKSHALAKQVDFIGAIFLCLIIGSFLIGITLGEQGWKEPAPIVLLCICPVFVILLIVWEIRMKQDALFPFKLMKNRAVFLLNVISISTGYAMFTYFQTLPFYLSEPLGPFHYTSTLDIGLILFPSAIPGLIVAPAFSILSKKTGPALLISVSYLFLMLSFYLQVFYHDTVWKLVLTQIIGGFGMAGVMSLVVILLTNTVEMKYFATAAAVNSLFRIMGGAVGPIVSNIFILENSSTQTKAMAATNSSEMSSFSLESSTGWSDKGYVQAWMVAAIIISVGFLCSLFLPGQFVLKLYKRHQKHHHHTQHHNHKNEKSSLLH